MSSILSIVLALLRGFNVGPCMRSSMPLGPVFVVGRGYRDRTTESSRWDRP